MTHFEQVGVNFQMQALTVEDARSSLRYSCRCCNNHGMQIKCERCAIAQAHEQTIAILNDPDRVTYAQWMKDHPEERERINKRNTNRKNKA